MCDAAPPPSGSLLCQGRYSVLKEINSRSTAAIAVERAKMKRKRLMMWCRRRVSCCVSWHRQAAWSRGGPEGKRCVVLIFELTVTSFKPGNKCRNCCMLQVMNSSTGEVSDLPTKAFQREVLVPRPACLLPGFLFLCCDVFPSTICIHRWNML